MGKSTPGPWLQSNRLPHRTHNHPERFWEQGVHAADTLALCLTGHGATPEEAAANAKLGAAANDLLAACKKVVTTLKPIRSEWLTEAGYAEAVAFYRSVEAAIAKAEGRS